MTEQELNKYTEEHMKYYYDKEEKESGYFIHHNLSLFHKSLEIMNDYIDNFDLNNIEVIKTSYFANMDFLKVLELLEDFFKKMRIDIDINKAVMDGTIEPYYLHAKNYKVKKYFSAYFKSEKNKNVSIPNSNLAFDFLVAAHELAHLYNDPKNDDESSILSESFAIYIELMAGIYLESMGYKFENEFMCEKRLEELKKDIKDSMCPLEAKMVYLTFGKITEENYHKLFKDKDYDKFLNSIDKKEFDMDISLRYVFGYMLANYMKYRVINDYSFICNVNNFGKKMNDLSFEDCLKELNFDSIDDNFFEEMKNSLEMDLITKAKTK